MCVKELCVLNVYSHLHVSRIVRRYIQREFGVHLPVMTFAYGNMRPDFSPKCKQIPHYKKDMYENIRQEISDLANCEKEKMNRFVLAERLGVICHYLCDFFCYAHSEKFTGSLREHFKYESLLNHYIKQRRRTCEQVNFLADAQITTNLADLLERLDEQYENYIRLQTQPGFDMVCALQACIEVTVRVLAIIICKSQVSTRVHRDQVLA